MSQAIGRYRFLQISRFFHCFENTNLDKNDKYYKIQPVIEKFKNNCLKNFVLEQNLAYDESILRYYGRHIRFGYKIWSLNTTDVHQGKSPKSNADYDLLFGKEASPLVVMLDELPLEKKNLRYKIYMDNLFYNPALYSFLAFRDYFATGTIREKRILK